MVFVSGAGAVFGSEFGIAHCAACVLSALSTVCVLSVSSAASVLSALSEVCVLCGLSAACVLSAWMQPVCCVF